MLSKTTGGIVGLIVIDSPGAHETHEVVTGIPEGDGTLGQFFRWLCRRRVDHHASSAPGAPCSSDMPSAAPLVRVGRLAGACCGPLPPARVSADCGGLNAELEHATLQLRRTLAAAHASG